MKICSVENCERGEQLRRGYCGMHYKRWAKYGSTDLPRPQVCIVEDCDRTDMNGRGWCHMHYGRWLKHGDPETRLKRANGEGRDWFCVIDGCGKPSKGRHCSKHRNRLWRHGDPHYVMPESDRQRLRGPDHPHWLGDDIGYYSAHDRVRARRGRASNYQCVDCDCQATEWSYAYTCPGEGTELVADNRNNGKARTLAYCTCDDGAHCEPRCHADHVAFDTAHARQLQPA